MPTKIALAVIGPRNPGFRKLRALRSAVVVFAILSPTGVIAQDARSSPTDHAFDSREKPRLDENAAAALERVEPAVDSEAQEALCLMVESAARANDLPLEFFARVIWQESRFQSQAVGPVTRTGQRAQGIAQFMPGTAKERGLLDPFNPVQALLKSAEFLDELRHRFGNLGLAAAAYNAGPRRVQDWLERGGSMPQETRNYVMMVTGTSLENWVTASKNEKHPEGEPKTNCRELVALLKREPNRFVSKLEQSVARVVTKPWGVQIATGFDHDQALAMYSDAMKGLNAAIPSQDDAKLQPILFRTRGTSNFYQVRIGTDSRREAESLCKRIRLAHGACLVKRRSV